MISNCKIEEEPLQPTIAVRTKTSVKKLPKLFGKTYSDIITFLASRNKEPSGPPYATYFNMDMEHLDVEMGFPVAHKTVGNSHIKSSQLPTGKAATCLYTGPYDKIESAYNELSSWMEEEGYEPSGIAYEIYLNDPDEVPPDKLQTKIHFMLK